MRLVDAWEARGAYRPWGDHLVFVVDLPASPGDGGPPILLVHGFPTSSFDWRDVVDRLTPRRRVIAVDLLGYGLSSKPDQPYSLFDQADLVVDVVGQLGLDEVVLVTHDMGDTVGGELLARELDGALPFRVARRLISNGSIYIERANLSDGQRLMLGLPDAKLDLELVPPPALLYESLRAIFGPDTQPSMDELEAQYDLLSREDGHLLLPRLIRYIDERRQHEQRWTGAIEAHPTPMRIVWGDADPIAIVGMAETLAGRADGAADLVVLDGIGHFPMIEAPERFAEEVLAAL